MIAIVITNIHLILPMVQWTINTIPPLPFGLINMLPVGLYC